MRKVMLIVCLMTAIAASAQENVVDSVEEWVPDSIAIDVTIDSTAVDTQGAIPDIEEVEWNDRYAVAEKDGKWGVYDVTADSLVTGLIFDEAYPANRKRVFEEYVSYFSIRQRDRLGVVGIFESTNTPTIILAPPAANQDAQENWEDSVKVYQEKIQNGDAGAYLKLAECYHKGKGVEHNFPQTFWLIMQAADKLGEDRANQFFMDMPEDDVDRVKYEAAKAFVMGDAQKLRDVNKRLAELDAGSGELVEGLLAMIEKKNDEASKHFSKAIELGCKFAALFKGAVQQTYSEEEHANTLRELAKDYPFVYTFLKSSGE